MNGRALLCTLALIAFRAAPAGADPSPSPASTTAAIASPAPAASGTPDPFAYLEEVNGARARAWVRADLRGQIRTS
jgi:hypothetical protein